jgi:Uma2 family endonuclease
MTTGIERHAFTVDDYHRMAEAGILCEDDRVELIDGEIINMTPIGSRHMGTVDWLNRLFSRAEGQEFIVRVQGSIRLGDRSEPEPDILLLMWRADFYRDRPARPEDALLLIEVADSSLDYDRDRKGPLYASAGIAEYWLVDLEAETITAYREPRPQGYTATRTAFHGDSLSPLALPDVEVSVDELFPAGEG